MDRKVFSDLRSRCKTKRQMIAFNELVKSFADEKKNKYTVSFTLVNGPKVEDHRLTVEAYSESQAKQKAKELAQENFGSNNVFKDFEIV